MESKSSIKWLVPLFFLLALFAASPGLLWLTDGHPYPFTSHRSETVNIFDRSLYRFNTVSSVAQEQANDLTTLVFGLPLLAGSTWLASRGSLRGKLLLGFYGSQIIGI